MMVPILVTDDSKNDLGFTQRALVMAGIRNPLFLFSSGEQCLLYFSGGGPFVQRHLPCIAFIDLVMSPLSGIDVLERLKDLPAAKGSVPIMLSGLADYKMIQQGYAAGAVTFLVKPVSSEEIIRTLSGTRRLHVIKHPDGLELTILPGPAGLLSGLEMGEPPPALGA
jgi:CheY-like chemotaxis protein